MTGMTLTLHSNPDVYLDASQLSGNLPSQPIDEILQLRLPILAGKGVISVHEIFDVRPRTDNRVVFQGNLSNLHRIGNKWSGGELVVEGDVGDGFVTNMSGGEATLRGNAGNKVAQQMRGGTLRIHGNVGDDLGSPLHGRRSGLSGGAIHVIGNVGNYAGYRMRRGTLLIEGSCGTYLGCDIVAGTILTTGQVAEGMAVGMHRGTLIVPEGTTFSPLRFTPPESQRLSISNIIANDIQNRLPLVATALRAGFARSLGDLTCGGRGEVWFYERR